MDQNNPTSIIVGRTGSGKSALIRKIKDTHENVLELNPENLALGYLSDSWLLRFLTENEFDLTLFYQQLWRHVLVIELLKFYEGLDDRKKAESFLFKFNKILGDSPGKREAMDYLQKFGGNFWSDTDERVKKITDDFERQVEFEGSGSAKVLAAKYKRGDKLGRHETKELVSTAKKIVNSVQMKKLARLIEILDEDIFTDRMKRTVLVIDDLDQQWTDDRLRIKLIEALIIAIPKFRKIRNIKIVIAMRDDLLEMVLDQTTTSGFQPDKFQDYHQRISSKTFELKRLIEVRINKLFRKKYTKSSVGLDDIFEIHKTDIDYFDYISDRTMLRPRDFLAYFNMILEKCGGRAKVTLKDLRSVELAYSHSRRIALINEWQESMPYVEKLIEFLGHRKLSATFRLATLSSDAIDQFATELCAEYQLDDSSLVTYAKAYFEDQSEHSRLNFIYKIIQCLYRIGAIGLRTQENSRWQFSFISKPSIALREIGQNTHCIVHPMLWQSLGRRADLKGLFRDS